MAQTLAISETTTSLAQAETELQLQPADDSQFFSEWAADRPDLTEAEKTRLNLVKQRFLYQRKHGYLAEGAVNFVVMSPLLELAGFYDPPFLLRSEVSVKFAVEEQNQVFQGRIDALVIQDQLWVLLIESKQTAFSLDVAIPQALAYMAYPLPQPATFGLVSNGGYFMFLKLAGQTERQYALSNDFSLYRQQNELFEVLSVLKGLRQQMV